MFSKLLSLFSNTAVAAEVAIQPTTPSVNKADTATFFGLLLKAESTDDASLYYQAWKMWKKSLRSPQSIEAFDAAGIPCMSVAAEDLFAGFLARVETGGNPLLGALEASRQDMMLQRAMRN